MYKKTYEKPTITVVELNQHGQLLTGSSVQASRDSYGKANKEVSPAELNDEDEWEWD